MASWKDVLKRVAVLSAGAGLVYALSGCGGNPFTEPEDKYANEAWPPRPLPSPDGSSIVFAVQRKGVAQIARINPDGSHLTLLTHEDRAADSPAYSPDGRLLVYSGSLGIARGLFIMDVQSGQSRQITHPENYLDIYPSFFQDGKRIVFARAHRHDRYSMGGWRWYDWDLYQVNVDGTGEERLTHEEFYEMDPPYPSPNGQLVVLGVYGAIRAGEEGAKKRIVMVRMTDHSLQALTKGDSIDSTPAFLPNGRSVAFVSNRGSQAGERYSYNVWTMDLTGNNLAPLTALNSSFHWPHFFPDGRSLVVVKDLPDGPHELWRMDADGKNLHRIVDQSAVSDG
jgi:Tol biopolymer transport system component